MYNLIYYTKDRYKATTIELKSSLKIEFKKKTRTFLKGSIFGSLQISKEISTCIKSESNSNKIA